MTVGTKSTLPTMMHNQKKILSPKNRSSEVQLRIGYEPNPITTEASNQLTQDTV